MSSACLPPFIFIEFHGQLCTSLSHIPFMPCIHCLEPPPLFRLQPFSCSNFLRHLCVPIFSLSVHLICHLLHVPSVIQFFFVFPEHPHTLLSLHSMLFILCSLCCTSCHSSFLRFWGILPSPYFYILCISCGYLHEHHYSTTASASKPLNLSFLHVPLSFFQLSVSIATFIILPSVIFHFLCYSFYWYAFISPHPV